VAVFVVVVREERVAERAGVLDAAEANGQRRAVLEGLELALAEGVVVAHMRAAVGSPDAQEREQLDHGA
jgi:Asp-tRNA(Asn)/Glu-tRNA(Gln) amidotransferase A subunit family amidase